MPVIVVATENNICGGKCVFRSCSCQCPIIKHLQDCTKQYRIILRYMLVLVYLSMYVLRKNNIP